MRKILVTGATGQQGKSVVESLLKDGTWKIRATTRDPSSKAAKELTEKGVEVVKADQWSDSEMENAFKGVNAAFIVTNFWDPASMGKEVELGKKLADLGKKAGVQHYIYSSLADVERISKGKYKVPHFTDKAKVQNYIKEIGLKSTFIGAAFYYQNFKNFQMAKKQGDTVVFTLPLTPKGYLTAFDVNDTGDAVVTALNNPSEWEGKFIPLAGTHQSVDDYVKQFTEVTGLKAIVNRPSLEEYAKYPFPGAEELAQMFGWFEEFTYFGPEEDLKLGHKAVPNLKSYKDWLKIAGEDTYAI